MDTRNLRRVTGVLPAGEVARQMRIQPSRKLVVTVTRKLAKCESEYELAHDRHSASLKRRHGTEAGKVHHQLVQLTSLSE
ncbi:hypothetical protein EVAR_70059_1 [Eumeta japonica]|uniref:Uncharacterized protein n=1 Tax=Eumeta variegata TaxID=151549 RepID=A0A4C2AB86_EUMVA|nr:hypothetical protein EVAR_70059_1 [Eumeta japonica]